MTISQPLIRTLTRISLTLVAAALLSSVSHTEEVPRNERVLTQAEQARLTPEQVVSILKAGNERYVSGVVTKRDHSKLVRDAVDGQFPKAIILSCIDSRIPTEDVFDLGIGDLFVARIAGNFANTDIVGSMEFACKVSGSKLVLVLGHENCGAVKGAINHVELGNITHMLKNIQPAVEQAGEGFDGEQEVANPAFVEMVVEKNVRLAMAKIRATSPILKDMEKSGDVRIVGAVYHMNSGTVTFLK